MAKLSARGQVELARVERKTEGDGILYAWQRRQMVYRSDRVVLVKDDSRSMNGRQDSSGWRVLARVTVAVDVWRRTVEARGFVAV